MKKIGIILVVVFMILVAGYLYLFQGHREISTEKAKFKIDVVFLKNEFTTDAIKANKKYLDKTIQISGKVTSYDANAKTIVLDDIIFATFLTNNKNDVKIGNTLTIKGRFVGYDDLLEQYKLDQITIVE
jgi:hypothetical protein